MKNVFLFILIIFLSSCDANLKFSGRTFYVHRNISDHKMELRSYYFGEVSEQFTLLVGEEKTYDSGVAEGENNPPLRIATFSGSDSVVTIFDDTLSIMYDRGRLDGNPMRIDNYELVEAEKEPYIYLFEYTNEDYQRALDRGRIIK